MDEKEHFERLNQYFQRSKIVFDFALGGSKHFGFYPKGKNITESEAQVLMQELVAKNLNLTPKDVVLDAGCGQGIVSVFLAKKYGCKIEGITALPFEIAKANVLSKKSGVRNKVNYSLMDYNQMKFKDKFFNCIYTTESLSHSTDIKKTLKEFYRVLKKKEELPYLSIQLLKISISQNQRKRC